jgi:DNA polymerase III sliding clamp (beta) subunit (PCNA family)
MQLKLEGDISRSFALPLIDVSEEEVKMPSPQFDASVEINARILKEALKDASLFGSSVVFRVKTGQMLIEARGSSGTLHTVASQSKGIVIKSKGEVVSKYSLNFLQNIVREAEPEQKILLQMKSDSAMRVSYKIGPAQIEFYLAHMIL